FFRLPKFEEHLELHRLDCMGSHRGLDLYEFAREKLLGMPPAQIRPKPLINGDDLIAAGYQPGPEFKQILTSAEDAQLEGSITTKEEALQLVKTCCVPAPRDAAVVESHRILGLCFAISSRSAPGSRCPSHRFWDRWCRLPSL